MERSRFLWEDDGHNSQQKRERMCPEWILTIKNRKENGGNRDIIEIIYTSL